MMSQQMVDHPIDFSQVNLPWKHITIDFFGLFTTKYWLHPRSNGKIWGLVFVCLNMAAIHIDCPTGYDMGTFLLMFSKFCALHGRPSSVRSNKGSQLTSKSNTEADDGWTWSEQ